MLTSWILSIILIDAYLIVVEYTRESYAMQLGVSAMNADEFRDVMLNGYVWRRFRSHGRHEAASAESAVDTDPDDRRGHRSNLRRSSERAPLIHRIHRNHRSPPSPTQTPHREVHDEAHLEDLRTRCAPSHT